MATINQIKQLAEADTPLLLFQCALPSGDVECWSTHTASFNGQLYSARVLRHDLFDLQLSADDVMDGISQLSITLANADSALSELNAAIGFKGSQLTVYFAFADLASATITTESTVLFRGVAGDPDEITEDSLTLSFLNKLSLHRIPVPEIRIQRTCPWIFPALPEQRAEAKDGGAKGKYSRFYRCGYSADIPGGIGNLSPGGEAFTSCDKSRKQCQERGMFSTDSSANGTSRFGGFEFVPSTIMVRTSGDNASHLSPLVDNSAKYNDVVPVVYGTGWLKTPVIFARNDGNLTHMEVLAGMGIIQGILKIVVNDIEIPTAVPGADMTTTGWYSVITSGTRQGRFNLDFGDADGQPLGDPYGSMCVLSIVVPNRISSGKSVPTVEVLLQGMQIDTYNPDGTFEATTYTNNPAWVILDILRRCGWSTADLDLSTFASSALFCQTLINTTDLNQNPIQVSRYACNLVLTKRQSAAVVVRGIRVASSLMLRYGATGLLELLPETAIATQQPTLPDGGNSIEALNGGWPAYEFSDSSAPFSGIVRNPNGSSTLRLTSRNIAETSNRLSVEFQDECNEYQQDSLSLVDSEDSALMGYEISSHSTALGITSFNQATRVLLRQIDKSTKGNLFVQFQTSFRALKVRPGDIIALTYLKEGFARVPFRVVKLSPSMNYELVTILGQIHDDDWYSDNPVVLGGAGRQPGTQVHTPRPLVGIIPHQDQNGAFEYYDFELHEEIQAQKDGSATDTLTVSFAQPTRPSRNVPSVPLLELAPILDPAGGTLQGGSTFYYAVSAVDAAGNEGPLSFTVRAAMPQETNTNAISISGLSFPNGAASFNVYRGTSPQMLYRIASGIPLSGTYTDTGLPTQPIGPPDASFDHVNFYYRHEYAGPFIATSSSSITISCADMGAVSLAYVGMVVRIIEGTGRGQERSIATNDQTTLTVSPMWSVQPDASSKFVIAEASWRFAAVSASSPVQFEVPYRSGTVIQISGRGANVNNLEGTADLCPLTRWALGQQSPDAGVPAVPDFSLDVPGGGEVKLYQLGFNDLTNVSSVSSGTLQLFHWRELNVTNPYSLAQALDVNSTTVNLTAISSSASGSVIQVGAELMAVLSADTSHDTYAVVRGILGSAATTHKASEPVLHLDTSFVIVPFASNFFENRASINYIHTVSIPDIRICAAAFFVTNAFGDSQSNTQCFTTTPSGGLRTLSGGQFTLQVGGYLASQQNATPPLLVEASHAVRDVRASLGQAAAGYTISIDVLQNRTPYCNLTIPPASTSSNLVDGAYLPPLLKEGMLTMNVTLQVDPTFQGQVSPGRDLTVTIRL